MGVAARFRAWRRYRRMMRQLAELDQLDEQRRGDVSPLRHASRSPASRLVMLIGAVILVAVVIVVLGKLFPRLVYPPHDVFNGGVRNPRPAATGPYTFLNTTPSGEPVTYSSCTPIHYVVNPAGMPAAVRPLITLAVRQVGAASGLRFVSDGVTTEPPSPDRPPEQLQRYGHRYAPVLVAWADRAGYPNLADDVDGEGGSTYVWPAGQPESKHYVTGQILLFAQGLTPILASPDGPVKVQAIIMHELGHVVGLGHVNDVNELMDPVYTGLSGLGPGDRAGLRILGSGRCWPAGGGW